jgi:glycosyltransferase involved in cell wall biosynthesis
MSDAIQVSLCLTAFNRAHLLPGTLDSILVQSFPDFELIINDDCSKDQTQEVCLEYMQRDSRIKYFRNETNLNMPGNLNAALRRAKGEYIANLHDGDVFHHDLTRKWKKALETYPSAGFVFNACRGIDQKGKEHIYREIYPPLISGQVLAQRLLSRWDSCVYGMVMVRRAVYETLGFFDLQFGNYSDVDMWLRIAKEFDIAYIDEPLIDLMPTDPSRFYAFVHWKVVFWILGIHTANLKRYKHIMPGITKKLARRFPLRRLVYFLKHMALCLKHLRWDRVREGLAIWRDADDVVLRILGFLFGNPQDAPDWYVTDYWKMARLP